MFVKRVTLPWPQICHLKHYYIPHYSINYYSWNVPLFGSVEICVAKCVSNNFIDVEAGKWTVPWHGISHAGRVFRFLHQAVARWMTAGCFGGWRPSQPEVRRRSADGRGQRRRRRSLLGSPFRKTISAIQESPSLIHCKFSSLSPFLSVAKPAAVLQTAFLHHQPSSKNKKLLITGKSDRIQSDMLFK